MAKPKKKKSNRSKKEAKRGLIGPDKVTQRGPLRASQWGNVVMLENQSSPEQQQEIEQHLADSFPRVCQEIDGLVLRMCEIVRSVDSATLLQRAYWHVINKHLGQGPEESKVGHEHTVARRLLDYGQSLAVSIGMPDKPAVTDEQFRELRRIADQLFSLLNLPYFPARTAVARQQADFDEDREEFIVSRRCTIAVCAAIDI